MLSAYPKDIFKSEDAILLFKAVFLYNLLDFEENTEVIKRL